MASSYTQVYQYRDPAKVDLSSTFQAQSYKQQNYDINTQQTQQMINQYAGTDLLKDIDKEYFGQRLNTLVGFINQSGTRDWSRKSISDQLQNYVSTSLDKNVMNAIASTQSFRKQQAEIAEIKKSKPGEYSMQNEWFATQDIQRYLGSKQVGDTYHAQSYVPYTDVKKAILDNADKLKEFGIEYYTEPIGGNSYFTKVGKFEKIDPEKAKQYLSTILDAKAMNQLYIDGQYSYKDTKPEIIQEKYQAKLDSYNNVYGERLTELKSLALGATRNKKVEYENQIAILENNRNEINKQKKVEVSPQAMADYLYRTDFENKWTGFLSFNRLKDYKIDDSGFKIKQHIDNVDMANRNYNLSVDKFKYEMIHDREKMSQEDAQFNAKMEVDGYKKNTDGSYSHVGGPNSGIIATDLPKELQEERRANPVTTAEQSWDASAEQIKTTVAEQLKQTVNNGDNKFYADKLKNANFEHVAYLLVNRPDQYTGLYKLLSPENRKIIDLAKSNKSRLQAVDDRLNDIKTDMVAIGDAAMSVKTKSTTKDTFRENSFGYTLDNYGNVVKGDVLVKSGDFHNTAMVITQVNMLLKQGGLSKDDETAYKRLVRKTMIESGMSQSQMKEATDKMLFTKSYNGKLDALAQWGSALVSSGPQSMVLKGYQGFANLFESSGKPFTFADDIIKKGQDAGTQGNRRGIIGEINDNIDGISLRHRNKDFNDLGGENFFSNEDIDSSKLKDASGTFFKPGSIMTRWENQLGTAKQTLAKDEFTTFNRAFNIDMSSKAGAAMRGTFMALMPVGTDLQKDSNVQITVDKETGIANITAAVKQGKEYVPTTFQTKIGDLPQGLLANLDLSTNSNPVYSARNSYAVNYSKEAELPTSISEWNQSIEKLPPDERNNAYNNPPVTKQDILHRLDANFGKEIVDKSMKDIEKILDSPVSISNIRENGQWTVVAKQNNDILLRQQTGQESYNPDLMENASNKIVTEAIETRIKQIMSNGRY